MGVELSQSRPALHQVEFWIFPTLRSHVPAFLKRQVAAIISVPFFLFDYTCSTAPSAAPDFNKCCSGDSRARFFLMCGRHGYFHTTFEVLGRHEFHQCWLRSLPIHRVHADGGHSIEGAQRRLDPCGFTHISEAEAEASEGRQLLERQDVLRVCSARLLLHRTSTAVNAQETP